MELDFKTILFFIVLNNVFVILLLSYFLIKKNIQKWFFLVYLLGKAFQTLSLVGIMQRDNISMFLSIHVSNFFLIFSFGINAFAILSYDGKFRKKLFYSYLVGITIFYLSYLLFVNNYSIRMVIKILASVFAYGLAGIILFKQKKKYNFVYLIGTTFFVFSIFQIIRALFVLQVGSNYDFFNEILIDKLFFIVTSLSLSVSSIGFLLLLLEMKTETISEKNQIIQERNKQLNENNQTIMSLQDFKEQMMHMMIHDLKTPLSTIINAHTIKDSDEKNRLLRQSGYRMQNLIDNILGVYTYKNSSIKLNKVKLDLSELIKTAKDEISFNLDQQNILLEINSNVNRFAFLDKEFMRRVMVNILTNAIKFSPKNGLIKINIKENRNNSLKISISNQGPQIPKEKQKDIFLSSKQLDSRKLGTHSFGIGLAFCKLAIEAHGGEIGVVSEENSDVVFWFTIPDCLDEKLNTDAFSEVSLTEKEKDYLKPFISDLLYLEIYQITEINKILRNINAKSEGIIKWRTQLEKFVYEGDQKNYRSLLII